MPVCERCATENPEGFRFCGACGTPFAGDESSSNARKVVTALFCDIVDSTALGESLDPEALRNLIHRYFEEIRATIERHGGTVEKFAGDAVMAVFGVPRVHEDDALRAVRAAAEIRERMPRIGEQTGTNLRFRTGVNTGLVLTEEGDSLAVGDAVNVAARLEQVAAPDEILLGSETLRLVRNAVKVESVEPLALKGKADPVAAFRLLAVDPVAPGWARRLDVPFVGRSHDLALMRAVWDRTVGQPGCHLVTILGAPGVGKSRLVTEFLAEVVDGATTLGGRCLPYGDGITFSPITEALAALDERARSTLERLAGGGAATPEELFLEVRRLLESLATDRPLILHIDELQWAEPMLLDLLDSVTELSREAPILLLCTARLELLEDRPGWAGGGRAASTVILEPLNTSDSETLVDALSDSLSRDVRAQVIATSGGNPLFLQEMIEVVRERGAVVVPPTIQALLAARIEGLEARDRELLERGAVEGEIFHVSALRVLVGSRAEEEIASRLAGLVRKDMIAPHPADSWGGHTYRFRHLLIRDAAYGRLPKVARADLHARFAKWLETIGSDLIELNEIAGWHLEQAVGYQRDLGLDVDSALKHRAAKHLHAAGRRAADRSDASAARALLERAIATTEGDEPLRATIGIDLAEVLIEAGELTQADQLLTAAERGSSPAGHGPAALNRLEWLVLAKPEQAAVAVESRLPMMLDDLRRTGDERHLAKAHMLAFWVHWASNRSIPAAEECRLAAEHAEKAADRGQRSRAIGWYVVTMIYGPQTPDLIGQELDAIEREGLAPYLAACVALGRGEVHRLYGRFSEGHAMTQRAVDGFAALGMQPMAAGCVQQLAQIELSEGQIAVARESLLLCDAMLAELGERPQRATTQALLARVHELLGDPEPARDALGLAEQLSAPEDAINFAITDSVRARLALAENDRATAERCARSAVGHAYRTDFVGLRAEARLGLARVLHAIEQSVQARSEALEALSLFADKGDRPGSEAAQSLLGRSRPASS